MGDVIGTFGVFAIQSTSDLAAGIESGAVSETDLALIGEALQTEGVADEALFNAIRNHGDRFSGSSQAQTEWRDLIAGLLRQPQRSNYWGRVALRLGHTGLREKWLAIYKRAPVHIRTLILRREGTVSLKEGQLDRLLKRLQLTGSALASILNVTGSLVSEYRKNQITFPKVVYSFLSQSTNREDALRALQEWIVRATALYTIQYPYYEQTFELRRLLKGRGVRFGDSKYNLRLRGGEDITAVLNIARQDIPPLEMEKQIVEVLCRKVPALLFFKDHPSNVTLREAPVKFGTTEETIASLFGFDVNRYHDFARGYNPVPKRVHPLVKAMQGASTLDELRARIAALPQPSPRPSRGEGGVKKGDAPRNLDFYVKNYSAQVQGKARSALKKFNLGTEANAQEIAQDVFMALDRLIQQGSLVNKEKITGWFYRVVKVKVFDFFLQSRGIAKSGAHFYFRLRKLIKKQKTQTGNDFSIEDLMVHFPYLTRRNAEAHMKRYEAIGTRFRGIEIANEDLPPSLQQDF